MHKKRDSCLVLLLFAALVSVGDTLVTVAEYDFSGDSRASVDTHALSAASDFADGSGLSGIYNSATGTPLPCLQVDALELANSESDSISSNDYWSFTVTPAAGELGYQTLSFHSQASALNRNGAYSLSIGVYSSLDNYTARIGSHSEAALSMQDSDFTDLHEIDLSGLPSSGAPVTFRIVAWDSSHWNLKKSRIDTVTVTAVPHVGEAVAMHDNFVRGGTHSSTVQGSAASSLTLKNSNSASYDRKAYVRFSFAGGDPPDPEGRAVLHFYGAGGGGGGGTGIRVLPHGLKAGFSPSGGMLGSDWVESAITWDNAPANQNGEWFTGSATNLLGDGNFHWVLHDQGGPYVTPIDRLGDYLQAGRTVTVMFTPGDWGEERINYLASSEHATIPGPTLYYTLAPRGSVFIVR